MLTLAAARGEMEARGRGSLHGHWVLWGVAMPAWAAMQAFANLPPHEQVAKLKAFVLNMDKLLPTDAPQRCASLAVHPWQRPTLEGAAAYHPGHDGQLPYGRPGRTF